MKTSKTFTRVLGGSMAATALAGGALLAQAPVASASSDWDRLAECESNGNWSINTGNGYYGGLQFSQQSWQAVGGSGLPSNASKSEQIQRAEQLRQIQGWGAWPACSAQLGLSGSPNGTPSGNSGGGESAPQQQTQQAPQQQQTQQAPAPQEQPQQPAPQPQAEAPQQTSAPAEAEVSGETYTVQSGDSLTSIAAALGVDWTELWNANADSIEDPNMIFVGDQLLLPVVN